MQVLVGRQKRVGDGGTLVIARYQDHRNTGVSDGQEWFERARNLSNPARA